MGKKLYLIDVAGYVYRSYYALPRMTNADGQSTNALYGFIRSFLRIVKDFSPEYAVAVFDGPDNKKGRTEIFADYKSNRMQAPEDLPHQMEWAFDFCRLYGLPQLSIEGVEADDTIGSIVEWNRTKEFEIYICTGDKDLCQLVSENVFVLQTHKENLLLDAKGVQEVYGVPPHLIVDYLAIVGDQSDNIPGLPGFGPKTAVSLLQEFGSLDNLLANITKVTGKKKQETLLQYSDTALLSRRLALIHSGVAIPSEEMFYKMGTPDVNALMQFYRQMDFKTLAKDLSTLELFQELPSKEEEKKPLQVYKKQIVENEASFAELMLALYKAESICFSTVASSDSPMQSKLLGIAFKVSLGTTWYLPLNENRELDSKFVDALKELFARSDLFFCGHHCKFDLHALATMEIEVAKLSFDTMLASYLINSHSHRHTLEHLAYEYLDIAPEQAKKKPKGSELTLEEACKEGCTEADLIFQLKDPLFNELKKRELLPLFEQMELPLVKVLAKMEKRGIYIDLPYLGAMSTEISVEIKSLEKEIQELAGHQFNLNSPKQLGEVLYEKLGIKIGKKTATGQASTSAETLELLAVDYPIAKKILEYRSLEKLRSTYIDSLPEEVDAKTGRVHCSFNQTMAATGRLSCQNPNLQNIPIRTEMGSRIRQAFCPQFPNWSFLAGDYSQIELRLLAHLSEDPQLLKAFHNDEDIHAYTASLIFNIPIQNVTAAHRYQAKAVNFGIVYGQQSYGLSQELGISVKDASHFIEAYFERYKRVKEFLEECKKSARETGKALTMYGRERQIPDMNSRNQNLRTAAERLAINTPLQGSAADLIKLAMLEIDRRLDKNSMRSFMILQIHDELLFEAPDDELKMLTCEVTQAMQEVALLKVPLKVDIAIGKNWKEC